MEKRCLALVSTMVCNSDKVTDRLWNLRHAICGEWKGQIKESRLKLPRFLYGRHTYERNAHLSIEAVMATSS